MKKIKKAFGILRDQGLKKFFQKLGDFFVIQVKKIRKIQQRIYFFFWKKSIIKKIQTIDTNNPTVMQDVLKKQFLGVFNPQQVSSEFKRLLKIVVEKKPKIILEIGTANGGSLFSWCKLLSLDATIISVDLPAGDFGGGYPEWKIPFYNAFTKKGQALYLVRADSHKIETVEQVKKILNGNMLDFLFIDGDHTYEGVKKDFELFSPFVKKGGFVAFHDVAIHPAELDCFVHYFWVEIQKEYRDKTEEIIENQKQG